jgi:hypothetical protein
MSDNIEERFARLFSGRTEAHGAEGGMCVREALTDQHFSNHLWGEEPIGVYPMFPQVISDEDDAVKWYVNWGCVDLDVAAPHKRRWDYENTGDALRAACNLVNALNVLGIVGWVEASKSGGYHVWVFSDWWIEASVMRRALLVACDIAEVPPSEVNPKAESFEDEGTLGNYVRLPYVGALAGEVTRPVINPWTGEPIPLGDFLDQAEASAVRLDALDEAAALWLPEAPLRAAGEHTGTRVPPEAGSLSRRLTAVLEHGPLKAQDRSGWLFYVARLCADDGIDEEQALDLLIMADDMHTHKFTDRADGQRQLERTIRKAYS